MHIAGSGERLCESRTRESLRVLHQKLEHCLRFTRRKKPYKGSIAKRLIIGDPLAVQRPQSMENWLARFAFSRDRWKTNSYVKGGFSFTANRMFDYPLLQIRGDVILKFVFCFPRPVTLPQFFRISSSILIRFDTEKTGDSGNRPVTGCDFPLKVLVPS